MALVDEGVGGHDFDASDAERASMRDHVRVGEAGETAACRLRHVLAQLGQAAQVRLVNDGAVPGNALPAGLRRRQRDARSLWGRKGRCRRCTRTSIRAGEKADRTRMRKGRRAAWRRRSGRRAKGRTGRPRASRSARPGRGRRSTRCGARWGRRVGARARSRARRSRRKGRNRWRLHAPNRPRRSRRAASG